MGREMSWDECQREIEHEEGEDFKLLEPMRERRSRRYGKEREERETRSR